MAIFHSYVSSPEDRHPPDGDYRRFFIIGKWISEADPAAGPTRWLTQRRWPLRPGRGTDHRKGHEYIHQKHECLYIYIYISHISILNS